MTIRDDGGRAGINRDLVLQRIQEIRGAVAALRTETIRPQSELVADVKATKAAKYDLVVAIEAAVSICTHLVSRLAARTPESYADCFAVLRETAVFEADLAGRLGRMAQFRNRLVHLYWKVDDEQVWAIVRGSLGDLEEYIRAVGALLNEEASGETPVPDL